MLQKLTTAGPFGLSKVVNHAPVFFRVIACCCCDGVGRALASWFCPRIMPDHRHDVVCDPQRSQVDYSRYGCTEDVFEGIPHEPCAIGCCNHVGLLMVCSDHVWPSFPCLFVVGICTAHHLIHACHTGICVLGYAALMLRTSSHSSAMPWQNALSIRLRISSCSWSGSLGVSFDHAYRSEKVTG